MLLYVEQQREKNAHQRGFKGHHQMKASLKLKKSKEALDFSLRNLLYITEFNAAKSSLNPDPYFFVKASYSFSE